MTFTNAVVAHPDVAEFQWEPISAANSIPIDHLSGTLTFPKSIDKTNSWAWMHYEGSNSTTSRTTDGGLKFGATNVWGGNYVAIRAMFDSSAVTTTRTDDSDAKQRIMDEEITKEENWHSQQQSAARIRLTVWIVLAALVLLLSVFALIQAIRTNRGARYHGNLDYWREPPEMSPAAAAHLLHVMDPSKGKSKDILTATILSLASKKAIVLLPGGFANYVSLKPIIEDPSASPASVYSSAPKLSPASTEETTTIAILPAALDKAQRAQLHLSASEDSALGVLLHIAQAAGRPTFDLKELKDLFKDNDEEAENVNNALLSLASSGTREFDALHATSSSMGAHLTSVVLLMMLSIASIIVFGATGQLVLGACVGVVGLVIATVALVWGSDVVLNEKGQELAGTVRGLRNYLLDFSTFQDRGVADLALWDRYLVYAAAFGISREVAKQLALAQPQIADQQWLDSNAMTYPLVYSFYRPLSFGGGVTAGSAMGNGFSMGDIGGQISSNIGDIQSTISTAMSSGSGSSGGSFGGGGFGGGGGGVGGGSFGGR
jgi:uncharacterized membrane protein